MSSPPQRLPPRPRSSKKAKAEKEKPRRSLKERAIVWTGIAILIVIVIVEGGARLQYSAALQTIDNVQREAGGKAVKIDQIVPLIGRQPTIEKKGDKSRGLVEFTLYTWKWSGVVRTYTIALRVDEEGDVAGR